LNTWQEILNEVQMRNAKTTTEMEFPSIMGERTMQVNAIPEYNAQNVMESILMVSHDITERKTIELEISQKNRKITESINYAKRIQEAILPDINYIRQYLPNSFMIYKPRDVVSGDFPWFFENGDNIYIAAVDCTGHGVPGALISFIGFFLLNNIVNMKEEASPSEILDILDVEVTRTLKQDDSDSSTRDGMDIALCKLNPKKRQIEYAAAHRPLYYLNQGDLYEIKGNKFPIGGAQYQNHMKFTNTIINYQEGDSIYMFSDGLPDQFGGPKNKKFSPRKIRDVIIKSAPLGLSNVQQKLDEEFEQWKGSIKQTDDVLFIGIKM
jgi:serine phosphatase RsbU (regulator of sigma subunit)